jgi:hypothetical protein
MTGSYFCPRARFPIALLHIAIFLAGAIFMTGLPGFSDASANESFAAPRLQAMRIDWTQQHDLSRINAASGRVFPTIADSAVPVLLPLDMDALSRDNETNAVKASEQYLSGFRPTGFFLAGPSGYDATFSFSPASVAGFGDIRLINPIPVTISGFAFLYDLPPPVGAVERPAPSELAEKFPSLRRQILEHTLRYGFERYGVPYVVSIPCHDGGHTPRRLSCRNAERVAQRFLQALQFSGGSGKPAPGIGEPQPFKRPAALSSVFTYHPAGSLIPGSGMKGQDGSVDKTVYARIRFPIKQAPAFANSQSFMHWGDCDQTGMRPRPRGKDAIYLCRVNTKPLTFNEAATENYAYPWRDNFCEHRYFAVGQCPAGLGHQGQDIRPAHCELRNEGANRCEAYRHDVVAPRDAMILREPWNEALLLHVNTANERIRFRYLHMHPERMNAERLLSGRMVREGEMLGQVGNFNRRENWTTYHLHVELQVPTRDGWVRVNPYMTLVASYEHLIQGRGTEITDPANEPQDLSGHEATAAKSLKSGKAKTSKAKAPRQKFRKFKRRR